MTKLRQRRATFLPAILICLVAVNAHAVAHLDAGSVECEFCSSQHDPSDALVAAETSCLSLPSALKPYAQRTRILLAAPFISTRQRGPPLSTS